MVFKKKKKNFKNFKNKPLFLKFWGKKLGKNQFLKKKKKTPKRGEKKGGKKGPKWEKKKFFLKKNFKN
ncbi:MAG: hypothetical protein CM15mV43_020 [uncultured marine virus]|nr:MAG: hypothetical protein CM15mV43_020 [uncultured marine virus]